MLTRRELLGSISAAAALAAGPALAESAAAARPGFFAAKDVAEEGFIFGLPIVMNYGVMYEFAIDKSSGQYKAPFNALDNARRVFTYEDTAVPTPNSDTPYSILFADLRAEPLAISVPAVDPKRYYSVMLCDASTYNYGYIGSRATGTEAGDYLIAGPDWQGETPPGIKQVFRSGSQFSAVLFRTQLFNPEDMPNVIAIQDQYKVRPLSAFLGKPAPAPAPEIAFPKIDKQLAKTGFFEYLDFMLQFIPPQPNEADIRAKLASIGIGPGKTFNFRELSVEDKLEIVLGMKQGQDKVDAAVAAAGKNVDGWRVSSAAGDSSYYNADWLTRAVVAQAGIYANDSDEAMYPYTRLDSDGETLDGSRHSYTLTFPAGLLPPVNAFWSITMYDGKTQLLIKNPINRYLINTPMLPQMKTGADGSLTIYISKDSPGADKASNWLPAPDGPIYMVMRLYWPKTTPPSILPPGEGTWRPPGVKRVS
jgi:hypothetical protein